ncbi:MAG: glutathione S-transferase family protein [Alphaproteobacteria bacterium]
MLKLYGDRQSGNCYKPRLLLERRDVRYRWVDVDVPGGGTRTPEFLAKNSNGRVPLLEIEPGVFLAESNAMLFWLAEGTPWLPDDRLERAFVMQWLFFEQYSHEPYIATSRYWLHYLKQPEAYRARLDEKRPGGYAALGVMEGHLAGRDWFVGSRCTIADIALYAYTHVAHEGGFDLGAYPAVRGWLDRVAAEPGHVPMV